MKAGPIESVRDDEICGVPRGKEVRTPELIGQIKNFMKIRTVVCL